MGLIIVATPNLKLAAIFYFLSAFVALVLGLAGYYLMHKTVLAFFFIIFQLFNISKTKFIFVMKNQQKGFLQTLESN